MVKHRNKKTLSRELERVNKENPGSDLLFHTLAYSTIGDERLDF